MNNVKNVKGRKVLVVDDEVYLREILSFDLERLGYQVSQADSGIAALAMIKANSYDVVISDVRMPSGNGLELLQWIKALNPISPSFIFMTAFADVSADEAMDKGAEAFLSKPLVRGHLLEEVAKASVSRFDRWLDTVGGGSYTRHLTDKKDMFADETVPSKIVLGSGGMFCEMEQDFPQSLEIVSFDYSMGDSQFEGIAQVRWVRHETSDDRPAGVGLEFLHLKEKSREWYLEFLRHSAPGSYVPLGRL